MFYVRGLIFGALVSVLPANVAMAEDDDFVSPHNLPKYQDGMLDSDEARWQASFIWAVLANTYEVNIHQMNGETGNQVFVHKDGHSEAVYDKNGDIVKSCANQASYNYFVRSEQPLLHFYADAWPWIEWGNCRKAATKKQHRLEAYLLDFRNGTITVLNHIEDFKPISNIDVSNKGQWETIALFSKIMAQQGNNNLVAFAKVSQDKSAEEFEVVYEAFAKAFIAEMMSGAGK